METNEFHGSAQETSAPNVKDASDLPGTEDQQSHVRSADDVAADEALWSFRKSHFRCHNVDRSLRYLRGKRTRAGDKLSMGARTAFLMVLNFETAFFSIPYLAELFECAVSTARGYVAELEDAKLVWRHENRNVVGGCGTNTYEAIFDAAEFDRRGTPAKDRWHKPSVRKPRIEASDGEGALWKSQGGWEQATEPAPEAEAPSLSAALFESDPAGDKKLERDREVREDRPAAPPVQRLALRGCSHPLLDQESNAALLRLPGGRGALKKLTQFGLNEEQALRAVKKLLQYDAVKGVQNAAGLLHRIIEDLLAEQDDRAERRAASIGKQWIPDFKSLPDEDVAKLKGNVRKRNPGSTEKFLKHMAARAESKELPLEPTLQELLDRVG